jgi:hypothetical protein
VFPLRLSPAHVWHRKLCPHGLNSTERAPLSQAVQGPWGGLLIGSALITMAPAAAVNGRAGGQLG